MYLGLWSEARRQQLNAFYRAIRPRGYIGWGKSHQLRTGLGLAIGAKVAAPDNDAPRPSEMNL